MTSVNRVQCYFNLHRKTFSLRGQKSGLVFAYSDSVFLKNCKFKVSQAGRLRVIKEKKKNVHALVEGDLIQPEETIQVNTSDVCGFSYNPYKVESFCKTRNVSREISMGDPIYTARMVHLNKGVCVAVC